MTKHEKQKYISADTVAYYTGCSGLAIKKIEYGIDDYIIFTDGNFCGKQTAHRAKVYYANRPYFRYHDYTIHLDECIRA